MHCVWLQTTPRACTRVVGLTIYVHRIKFISNESVIVEIYVEKKTHSFYSYSVVVKTQKTGFLLHGQWGDTRAWNSHLNCCQCSEATSRSSVCPLRSEYSSLKCQTKQSTVVYLPRDDLQFVGNKTSHRPNAFSSWKSVIGRGSTRVKDTALTGTWRHGHHFCNLCCV